MARGSMVFALDADVQGALDSSASGVTIRQPKAVTALGAAQPTGAFRFERGALELARNPALDGLQSFTVEATVTLDALGGERQNIAEAQTPPIALFVQPSGQLVGSVHTAAGWVSVDSGGAALKVGAPTRVRFSRDPAGRLELQIDGAAVGSAAVPQPLQAVGDAGFKVGAWVDGSRFALTGVIAGLQIRDGVISAEAVALKQAASRRIAQAFTAKTGLTRVAVHLQTDYSSSRLQAIKDIMQAAGVQKLSDLDTLRIRSRTVLAPGSVVVAPRRQALGSLDWSQVAAELVKARGAGKRELLAQSLANRNSAPVLRRLAGADGAPAPAPPVTRPPVVISPRIPIGPRIPITPGGRVADLGDGTGTGLRVPAEVLRESPTLRRAQTPLRLTELIRRDAGATPVIDRRVIDRIEADDPAAWPVTSQPSVQLLSLKTIPVNSAVMIGQVIDLTNTELVVEPNVSTFYIIAEQLICGPGAKITWRRPGGSTPPRQDNPDLNGRGWSGVHTKHDSRDGLDGDDGRGGAAGIDGASGAAAPHLELWVKQMSAMPNLDLSGEEGRQGGRGQRGGSGGRGADGEGGKWAWFFGKHCVSDPGDGGDGGNGGSGGRGGRGGRGGHGGRITIGVLEDTLEDTVTSKAFLIKNHGAGAGRGGAGGAGGAGGRGGRSGVGEVCKDARDGRAGAQGQPGPAGADGATAGIDGDVSFHEFTEAEWDALLTRPWLAEVIPTTVFPGDQLTLRGSRFSAGDRVVLAGSSLAPAINADESISVTVPQSIAGGATSVFVRRGDGTESNRVNLSVKPQLEPFAGALNPGATVSLTGRAFLPGAAVLVDGAANPATVASPTRLSFTMPGTGGAGSGGGSVSLQVRNPDGLVSNARSATIPRILEIPFRFGVHNLTFGNFKDGVPDWGTYQDTFGAAEVWHEQLDPIFGHPILTAAYYAFYQHFLKGEDNGGLATGFCTSLASLVADKFWQGHTDATTLTKAGLQRMLTAVHGKLLSRESLIHFHDQGREGVARVARSAREVEATFLRGADRENAPLIFFIPSGAVWDGGYFDKLSDSHCVMPYRFVYPSGHPGPQLAPGGATTLSDLNGVELYVWDCNHPNSTECRLVFRAADGRIEFDYLTGAGAPKFRSQDGITLGMMTNGAYMLADHDLPFSGPFGLTSFIIDFLLSPADLQILDPSGLRTGNFGGQLHAEIPDSHPCFLLPGAYMLPAETALTRRIVGTGAGTYTFNSISPDGASLVLQGATTAAGQVDTLSVSADGTQIRFTPAVDKSFDLTLARQVGDQTRAIAVRGVGGGPAAAIDLTISPELSLARVGNRGAARSVEVRAFALDRSGRAPINRRFANLNLPTRSDLLVAVQDWSALDASVEAISFE